MSVPPPPQQSPTPSTELRIATLRAEMEATVDRQRQAMLGYEIGRLVELAQRDEAAAVREYLGAYNSDPTFRPPLFALVSIFERRRSFKNLARLYDAEAKSAQSPAEAASAVADRAVLLADHFQNRDEARALLEAAVEQAPESDALALLLELELFLAGDHAAANEVVNARADTVADPVLATVLRLEVARARDDAGDVEGALATLRNAVATPAARLRVLEALERLARREGRHPERVVALEGRAKLALASARGEDQGQGSGAFSVQRFTDETRAAAEAAALYREAARTRAQQLGDVTAAIQHLDAAVSLRPDDLLLRYERMLLRELTGDLDAVAVEAEYLLEQGVEGAPAAALLFRLAELAQAGGDEETALRRMGEAAAADPASAVVAATLDDLSRRSETPDATLARLERRAEASDGPARAERLWEAAELAAWEVADAERADALFAEAAAASDDPAPILRERFGAALRLANAAGAVSAARALISRSELDDDERSATLRDLHELSRVVLEDRAAANAVLVNALETPAASGWAPELARLHGAIDGEVTLLVAGHRALAERADDDEAAAAHLSAAARAAARAGRVDEAVELLRAALAREPTHPYAVALLEEVLRARGDADEVVRLLREAAEAADAPRAAETQLLLAGAAAEAGDDLERAVSAYEDAATQVPTSLAPWLALERLARARADEPMLHRALEALAERELTAGAPGRHNLALGEHEEMVRGAHEKAEVALSRALESESTSLHAAVHLSSMPRFAGDEMPRLGGLKRLAQTQEGEARAQLLRELAGIAIAGGADRAAAQEAVEAIHDHGPRDRGAAIARLELSTTEPANRPGAWLSLGQATDDPEPAAELLLHGLRASILAQGEAGLDDGVILAHEVMAVAPDSLAAAIALDETLSAGDDPEGRADALTGFAARAGECGRAALESARGRALASAGRPREALEVLLRVAASEPEDLASWEAIRRAARDAELWEPLVEACDRLAHLIDDPELKMILWEESAAVLMDELRQDDRAERRLKRVLAIDARRPIAYGRLHDLLAEREDDAGLLELVSARIDLVDDSEELDKLFYEQARLLRSLGLREDALAALDNLLMLSPDHVGGLALLVELQVQRENWAGAVDALRQLASASEVPASQRRIARLGAADFLQHKLGDLDAALAELEEIAALGLADRAIHERMANIAVELERFDEAASHLAGAAAVASAPETVARLERKAGALHAERREDPESAVAAYDRALNAVPTDLAAAEAMATLLADPGARQALSARFEEAIRARLNEDPTDPETLRPLARAAAWRGDGTLGGAVTAALVALGVANEEEASAAADRSLSGTPSGRLDASALATLRAPGDAGPIADLAAHLAESLAEADGLEPGHFGLARGDLVKDDTPLKREVVTLAAALGLEGVELYVGGETPQLVDLMPTYKGKPTFVLGRGLRAPLGSTQRFELGTLAAAAVFGIAPFVRRGPAGAATALFAAAAAAEVTLAAGQGRAGMAEATRRLYKAMPRRVRKSLPDLFASLGDGRAFETWGVMARQSAWRAAMLLANDPSVALSLAVGGEPSRELVLESGAACDLLLFWLSPDACRLRERLGWRG